MLAVVFRPATGCCGTKRLNGRLVRRIASKLPYPRCPTVLPIPGRYQKHLRFSFLTFTLAMASAGTAVAAPQVGIRAIETTYHQLLQALDQSRGARPDDATRQRIIVAAQAFQDAMKRDGGARENLRTDVKNIVVSLSDGSYSADGSINALRRDAKGSVIDAGPWKPTLGGALIAEPVGTHLNQTSEGDCVGISVVRAFANTRTGAAILHKGVTITPMAASMSACRATPPRSTIYRRATWTNTAREIRLPLQWLARCSSTSSSTRPRAHCPPIKSWNCWRANTAITSAWPMPKTPPGHHRFPAEKRQCRGQPGGGGVRRQAGAQWGLVQRRRARLCDHPDQPGDGHAELHQPVERRGTGTHDSDQ